MEIGGWLRRFRLQRYEAGSRENQIDESDDARADQGKSGCAHAVRRLEAIDRVDANVCRFQIQSHRHVFRSKEGVLSVRERSVVREGRARHPRWEVLTGLDPQYRLADFCQHGALSSPTSTRLTVTAGKIGKALVKVPVVTMSPVASGELAGSRASRPTRWRSADSRPSSTLAVAVTYSRLICCQIAIRAVAKISESTALLFERSFRELQ
jgi:hypothetical protein